VEPSGDIQRQIDEMELVGPAPAAVPAREPKPLEPDPNCGHRPTKEWPDEFTAITNRATFKRYNDNKWRAWDPNNPWTLGKEAIEDCAKLLDRESRENFQRRKPLKAATPAILLLLLLQFRLSNLKRQTKQRH
jgi:hypothetical protein